MYSNHLHMVKSVYFRKYIPYSRFKLQIGPGSLLLREVDTVAIGILRGSLRIVHVVLAAGKDKKCQQER